MNLVASRWVDDNPIVGVLLLMVVVVSPNVSLPVNESRLAVAVSRCRAQASAVVWRQWRVVDRVHETVLLRFPSQAAASGRTTLWGELILSDQATPVRAYNPVFLQKWVETDVIPCPTFGGLSGQ